MPLLPNAVIEDRYVITRPLKTGGMGAIYAAVDRRLGDTSCALKELLNREGEDDQSLVLRKFEEEMKILAALNHPGIPRVRDYFMHDGTRYIVMDLVDGQNLEELLQESLSTRARPLLPTQVVAYSLQILEVLQYLHGHFPPIVHRDLKPANAILEKASQRVKLVDFGLARTLKTSNNNNQTAIASLGYAPVEQIQGRATVRSDIYALGATMFHLLTGNVPVPMDAGPVQNANVEIDDELARVVDKATAVDEADRFQSAALFTEALLAWKEGRATGLPRRRVVHAQNSGRLTRKKLPHRKPTGELPKPLSSPDVPSPAPLQPLVPKPVIPVPRPRSPWLRVLVTLSIVLLLSGLWLLGRSWARLSGVRAWSVGPSSDRTMPMLTNGPYPIQRQGLQLVVPAGWEVLRNTGNMEGDRSQIVLRRNGAVMEVDVQTGADQTSDSAVRDRLQSQIQGGKLTPAVGQAHQYDFDSGADVGSFEVRQEALSSSEWRLVIVRMEVPKGNQQRMQLKELSALASEIDLSY